MARRRLRRRWTGWWASSKWWVLLAAAHVTFALGVIGFHQHRFEERMTDPTLDPLSAVDASLLSLMLFVLNSQGEVDGFMPWTLQFARIAAPVIAFSAAIETFLAVFREQALNARVRRLSGHIVIGGLGRKGAMLARAFLDAGHRVVGLDQDPNVAFGQNLRDAGGWFLVGDLSDPQTLARVHASHARAIYFVASDDGANLDGLQAYRALDHGRAETFVHVQSMDLVKILGLGNESSGTRFFSVYESGARALLLENPAFTQREDGTLDPLDIAIVGRGEFCERIALALAQTWDREVRAQGEGCQERLAVKLVDPAAGEAVELLRWEHPVIRDRLDLQPVCVGLDTVAFAQARFMEGSTRAFRVYLTLRDQAQAVEAAWKLARSTAGRQGFVVVGTPEDSGLAEILRLEEARPNAERIAAFGLLDRAGTPELVRGGTFEALARALHTFWYRQFPAGKAEAWDDLEGDWREAAYRSADLVAPMLLSVGWWLERVGHGDPGAPTLEELPEALVDVLAEREHRRWLREGQTALAGVADPDRLRPWEEVPEEAKTRTREFVRALPGILRSVGFEIKPLDESWCQSTADPAEPSAKGPL